MPSLNGPRANKILIIGANGSLGQALLKFIGPKIAIAVTRRNEWYAGEFKHFSMATQSGFSEIPWVEVRAIINVAGSVYGTQQELEIANFHLPLKIATIAKAKGVSHFVQLSSFSVYGKCEHINVGAKECPTSAYGQSKLACDEKIMEMNSEEFAVSILRVPFLFDVEHPALFGPLLKVIKLLPFFPISKTPTYRSMISYADTARVLFEIVQRRMPGVLHAAAVEQFDYELLAAILQEEAYINLRLVRLPFWLTEAVELVAPNSARRLFRSSALDISLNVAKNLPGLDGLHPSLRALVKREFLNDLPSV